MEQVKQRRRVGALFLLLISALLLLSAASLSFGAASLSPAEAVAALFGRGGEKAAQIVLLARLPRTAGCVLAGAALALSGAVIQGVLHNPLAAPHVIGVNAGAGFAVAVFCAFFPTAVAAAPFFAFLGALAGVLTVLAISERAGASRMTLVLAGVAVSGMFGAGIDAAVTFVPDALSGYTDFRIGGVANLSMERITPAMWVILAAGALLFSLAGALDVLLLGEETAAGLGLRVRPLRFLLLALAAALAGAAVSFAGLLGSVGLIVPHIMRRLVGEESRLLLPGAALGGAVFLLLCDLAARLLFAPYELPVGIVLALVGGPFFLFLLLRQRRGRIHD